MYKKAHNLTDTLPLHSRKYREYRKELRLSAAEVADRINIPGLSHNTIYNLEYGHRIKPYYKKRIVNFYEKKLSIGKYAKLKKIIKLKQKAVN